MIGKGKLIFSTSIIFGGKNKKERKSLVIPILLSFFALAKRKQLFCVRSYGSLDEWLSQRSAKPCTAVRIRQEPRRKASKLFVMNASRLFLFCPFVTLAGLSGGSLFSWLP